MKSMWYLFSMHDVISGHLDLRAIFCQPGFKWVEDRGHVPVYPQDTCEEVKELSHD